MRRCPIYGDDLQPAPYSFCLCLEDVFCSFGLLVIFPLVLMCNNKKKSKKNLCKNAAVV